MSSLFDPARPNAIVVRQTVYSFAGFNGIAPTTDDPPITAQNVPITHMGTLTPESAGLWVSK
ncbi:hypothetical protein AGMMS49545_03540 [Betaproteobacteria bacterium]|nr:hypothetical protein AGMMS49545_03540 [Betaproteobacteria bacterium]GHU41684.1 hypothetical protein AGMMS50289_05220 [Betaproteobacteria bacterium]